MQASLGHRSQVISGPPICFRLHTTSVTPKDRRGLRRVLGTAPLLPSVEDRGSSFLGYFMRWRAVQGRPLAPRYPSPPKTDCDSPHGGGQRRMEYDLEANRKDDDQPPTEKNGITRHHAAV